MKKNPEMTREYVKDFRDRVDQRLAYLKTEDDVLLQACDWCDYVPAIFKVCGDASYCKPDCTKCPAFDILTRKNCWNNGLQKTRRTKNFKKHHDKLKTITDDWFKWAEKELEGICYPESM